MGRSELQCCVRGIYHNTFFAVWWSKQPEEKRCTRIEQAINARFIMNNVLSRMPCEPTNAPYLIWFPTRPHESTYRQLAKLQPDMLPQIVHACIASNYEALFNELLPQVMPDTAMEFTANQHYNAHFKTQLQARLASLHTSPVEVEPWKSLVQFRRERSTIMVTKWIGPRFMGSEGDFPGEYNGTPCDASNVELFACLPDAWRLVADDPEDWRDLDYVEWSPAAGGDSVET